MATTLAVVSLYFLHLGFRTGSRFRLSLAGIAAGLCLASSISGKQYLLALCDCRTVVRCILLEDVKAKGYVGLVALVIYGFVAAATPILLYIVFNREAYTLYESGFVRDFWLAMRSGPFPTGIKPYNKQLWDCFFTVPGPRFFIPDVLPIPLPYYWLLIPGAVLALWQKRFEFHC